MIDFAVVYGDLGAWAEMHGIRVTEQHLNPDKAGEFDGLSMVMNSDYRSEDRSYYLAHALGSMVRWSISRSSVQEMFDRLRQATKANDRAQLEQAIANYRAFETESSEFAVWLLAELGDEDAVHPFTNFMQADLEALTEFHRTGHAPVWRDFFAQWNKAVGDGTRKVTPFSPKPIPEFSPVPIEKQEIMQKQ